MKRVFCIFLVFVMFVNLSPSALASDNSTIETLLDSYVSSVVDEFALRNDIHFGDTKDEVRIKEKLPEDSRLFNGRNWFTQTVSGYDDTKICYIFEEEKNLTELEYYFKKLSFKETSDSRYESIYNGLARKYGEPIQNMDGKTFIITTSAMYDSAVTTLLSKISKIDYNEWIVKTGDECYVKIDLVCYYYGSSYSSINYELRLGYKEFTLDDYYDAIGEVREKQEVVDKDL